MRSIGCSRLLPKATPARKSGLGSLVVTALGRDGLSGRRPIRTARGRERPGHSGGVWRPPWPPPRPGLRPPAAPGRRPPAWRRWSRRRRPRGPAGPSRGGPERPAPGGARRPTGPSGTGRPPGRGSRVRGRRARAPPPGRSVRPGRSPAAGAGRAWSAARSPRRRRAGRHPPGRRFAAAGGGRRPAPGPPSGRCGTSPGPAPPAPAPRRRRRPPTGRAPPAVPPTAPAGPRPAGAAPQPAQRAGKRRRSTGASTSTTSTTYTIRKLPRACDIFRGPGTCPGRPAPVVGDFPTAGAGVVPAGDGREVSAVRRLLVIVLLVGMAAPVWPAQAHTGGTVTGFENPESAPWDSATGFFYVSNMGPGPIDPMGRAPDGYISRISSAGRLETAKWVT